jgi:GT2 family glycosyltransferase
VDDDVSVEPGWLHSLTAAMMDGPWAGTGGRTLAAHPFPLPDWLSREHPIQWGGVLGGLLDLGDQPLELRMAPYGANMAFRKEMFVRYGGFRTDLGPRPGNLIRCEDTEFGHRLLNAGERLRYEPLAIVYHPIQENRLQKEYFLTWWFDYGRAQAREQGQRPLVRGTLRQYVEITAGMGARLGIRTLRWMRTLNPHQKFFYKCRVWMTIGQILEICGR